MARPRGKISAVCQNKECSFYHREKGKDIIKRGHSSSGTQMYKCLHCERYLAETKGTPMFRRRLNERKVKQLCKLLVEKNGVRSASRLTNLNKNTVVNWVNNLGEHALQITDFLVKNLGLSTYEVDEFWAFVKKNKKTLSPTARREIAKVMRGHTPQLNANHTSS
jgi:transposase-like protein